MGEVVVLDADNNTIETPFDDLENLPTDVVSKYLIKYNYCILSLIKVKLDNSNKAYDMFTLSDTSCF